MSKKYALPPVGRKVCWKFPVLFVLLQILLTSNVKAQWSQMNGGNCNLTYALCADATNTLLYTGMLSDPTCTGTPVNTPGSNHVGVWNGSAWSQLHPNCNVGGATSCTIYAIVASGNKVFIGGNFTMANGAAGYNGVACWDKSTNTWSSMNSGVAGSNATVYALTVDPTNNILYVGGEFTTAGGVTVNNIGAWNIGSSTWSAMGGSPGVTTLPGGTPAGMYVGVYALTYCNSKLYVGGRFVNAGGAAANSIAAWNGSSWSALSGGGQTGVSNTTYVNPQNVASAAWDAPVMALTNDGTTVYVGGDFNKVNNATGCNNIAAWNTVSSIWSTLGAGMTWPSLGTTATDNTFGDQANVYALTMYNGNVIAGGDFMKAGTIGGANTNLFVAQWNGSAWSGMATSCGGAINSDIFCLAVSNNTLFAGGQFIPGPAGLYYVGQYTGAGPTITMNVGSGTTICSTASATLSASGASTYTWSANAGGVQTSTVSVNPTSTTVYTVTGASSGCSSSKTVTVTVVATPTLTVSGPTSLCNGSSAVLTAATASNYSWSTGATTNTISVTPGLGTTTYTVTGDNGNGCTATRTVSVVVSAQPTLSISGTTSTCSGNPVVLTAGTSAGTYTWSSNAGGASTSTVSLNPASTTTYTLSGTNGACSGSTAITVTVTPTPTMSVNSASICSGQSAVLIASSNAATYTWSANAGSMNTSTVSVNPSSTTVYTVTGGNGTCLITNTATVTVNATPTVTISGAHPICSGQSIVLTGGTASNYTWQPGGQNTGTITVSPPNGTTTYTLIGANGTCTASITAFVDVSPTPTLTTSGAVICSGQSATLSASGASTFTWSANAGGVNTNTVSVNPTASTTYTLSGTTGSCTASAVTTVTVNPNPVIGTASVSPAPCGQSTGCINNVPVSGGTPAYQYSWNNGSTWSASSQYCNLPAGVYTLEVKDQNNCTATATVSIAGLNGPNPPVATASSTVACLGDSATLSINSPQSGIIYTWTDATGTHTGTSYTITNLNPGGNYTVAVTSTDANNCSASSSVSIFVHDLPLTSVSGVTHFCQGSGTVLHASPNGGIYSYQWTQGGSPITGATSANYTATTAGNYGVVVTNNSTGCKAASAGNYTVTVDSVPRIDTTRMAITNSGCNQSTGSITNVSVTPANGNTYSWTNSGGAVVGTGINLGNVSAGNYCLHVVTVNNCRDSICSLKVNSSGTPNAPVLATPNNTYCQGQTINPITVTGTPTITWYADPGLTTQLNTGATYTPSVTATTTLYVTSTSNGCQSAATPVVITINPTPSLPIVATPGYTYCQSQTVGAITANGSPTILWSTSPGMNPVIHTGNTYTPAGLPVGTTIFYLTDSSSAGCKSAGTTTVSVTINQTPADPTVAQQTYSYCQGQTINPISVNGTGTILWSTSLTMSPVVYVGSPYTPQPTPGTTVYYVKDSTNAGCKSVGTATVAVTINPTPTPPVAATPNYTYCQVQTVGAITVNGTGNVLWSVNSSMHPVINIGNSYTPTGLPFGTTVYYLEDSTNAGCKSLGTSTVSVTIYPSPTMSGGSTDTAKCGASNGGVHSITVTGGTPGYHYQWYNGSGPMNGDTLPALSGIGGGTYSVVITDAHGCLAGGGTAVFTVTATTPVVASITPHTSQGTAPLAVTFGSNASGATNYNWNFGNGTFSTQQNPPAVTYSVAGTYTVLLHADNGVCARTDTAYVTVDAPVNIQVPNIYSPNGDGVNDDWYIVCSGIRDLHCDIFNRWGQLVYQLFSVDQKWDGVMINGNHATEGTYYYIMEATGYDGKAYKSNGPLTLVK